MSTDGQRSSAEVPPPEANPTTAAQTFPNPTITHCKTYSLQNWSRNLLISLSIPRPIAQGPYDVVVLGRILYRTLRGSASNSRSEIMTECPNPAGQHRPRRLLRLINVTCIPRRVDSVRISVMLDKKRCAG